MGVGSIFPCSWPKPLSASERGQREAAKKRMQRRLKKIARKK